MDHLVSDYNFKWSANIPVEEVVRVLGSVLEKLEEQGLKPLSWVYSFRLIISNLLLVSIDQCRSILMNAKSDDKH